MNASLLYLSAADVERTAIPLDELRDRVEATFAAKARGEAKAEPKLGVEIGPGHFFHAMPGALLGAGLAGMKWLGLVPPANVAGPTISALVILSDIETGRPLAIMDGGWITAARTAALTAIAARALARPEAETIGFLGCGIQARSHLAALRRVLPRLRRVVACSRRLATAEKFAEEARAEGMDAAATAEPRRVVEGIDIVVSSVPPGPDAAAVLDPAWLAPGAFASAVDLGRSWRRDGIAGLDLLATDEHEQSRVLGKSGRLAFAGPYHTDLAELATGGGRRRTEPTQRAMFLFAGHSLADLAAADAVLETARRRGIGVRLTL
jgi:alanine dehydrogenase